MLEVDRRLHRRLGRRACRHAPGAARRCARHGRLQSGRHVRLRRAELGKRGIAFICAREALGPDRLGPQLKKAFGGVYIANEKMTRDSAEQVVASGEADAVAFGKLFIANPDLPKRLKLNAPLNAPQPETFYHPGAEGYVDYPALA